MMKMMMEDGKGEGVGEAEGEEEKMIKPAW